ncbi:hypothetical protein BDZ45DRAFT_464832 [Acephala macrosclerotiorum]|nr:hypothetical protein BDZ45DRAFT_464832 [Acephala macrosclerotiorum]
MLCNLPQALIIIVPIRCQLYAGRAIPPKAVGHRMPEGAGRETTANLLQELPTKAQRTQPLEPILSPKLKTESCLILRLAPLLLDLTKIMARGLAVRGIGRG